MDQRRIIAKTILIGRRLSMLKEFRICFNDFSVSPKMNQRRIVAKSIPID